MARRADSATAEIHDQGECPDSNQVDYCGNAQVGDDVFFGMYGMYSQPPLLGVGRLDSVSYRLLVLPLSWTRRTLPHGAGQWDSSLFGPSWSDEP